MAKQKIVRFDWAMKHLLRNKANYDIVEGFLCALFENNDLKVIEILESESNQDDKNDKFNKVDVIVKDDKDRNILIEIQNTRESDYLYRILFGTSKHIAESIDIGDEYKKISKVISISILYFNLGMGNDYLYYGKTEFRGLNTNEIIDKDNEKIKKLIPKGARYNQIEIFPEYYLIEVEKYKNVIGKAIDEWIYWFKNERIKEGSKSKNIKVVEEKLALLKMSKKERENYTAFLRKLVSERDMLNTSHEEGREEAEKKLKPIIKEKEKTIQEKEKEIKEKEKEIKEKENAIINSAKAMLENNMSIEQVNKITNLPLKIIENLLKQI